MTLNELTVEQKSKSVTWHGTIIVIIQELETFQDCFRGSDFSHKNC